MSELVAGLILLWQGAVANIPTGWALCNGANGTPDLRDKFVQGAGGTQNPGDTGGAISHTHPFTGNGHTHTLQAGGGVQSGAVFSATTDSAQATGTTNTGDSLPPFYALAYIMKL